MSRGPQCSGPEPVQPVMRLDSSHPSDTPAAPQVKGMLPRLLLGRPRVRRMGRGDQPVR